MKSTSRWVAVAVAALVLTTGATSYAEGPPSPAPSSSPAPAVGYSATGTWQLLALVNRTRRSLGLPTLVVDDKLAAVARIHTERMAASGDLRHNDALFTPVSRKALGMKALGENVGWNYSVVAQHDAFLKSTGHRANVVDKGFRLAGFAVVRGADGRIWSTEDFGTRA
jgi:uncharacterized protein YkwD